MGADPKLSGFFGAGAILCHGDRSAGVVVPRAARTRLPGTTLRLRFAVKPQPPTSLTSPAPTARATSDGA